MVNSLLEPLMIHIVPITNLTVEGLTEDDCLAAVQSGPPRPPLLIVIMMHGCMT